MISPWAARYGCHLRSKWEKDVHLSRFPNVQALCIGYKLLSVHPEMPDGHSEVSRSEMRNFVQDQENQGVARRRTGVRRTSKSAD